MRRSLVPGLPTSRRRRAAVAATLLARAAINIGVGVVLSFAVDKLYAVRSIGLLSGRVLGPLSSYYHRAACTHTDTSDTSLFKAIAWLAPAY